MFGYRKILRKKILKKWFYHNFLFKLNIIKINLKLNNLYITNETTWNELKKQTKIIYWFWIHILFSLHFLSNFMVKLVTGLRLNIDNIIII